MEKSIVEHFSEVLTGKNGHLSMSSLSGHLSDLSQKERKHIKQIGGLEKLIKKYPHDFLICDDEVFVIENNLEGNTIRKSTTTEKKNVSSDKKSTISLESAKDDPCAVCSDNIEIYAIGECRHPICFKCSTKLRVLCQDKNCPVCRQTLDMVVFSKRLLPVDEHDISKYIKDKENGIAFESKSISDQKNALLRHDCPICPNTSFDSFQSLESHARAKHNLYYCYICVQQCKIFTKERMMFTKTELENHIENGDNAGLASGGHPLCRFCNHRYLDNDELLRHLRMHHCSCKICDQENEEQKNYQFYADKNSLLDHQREKHMPCEHPDCMELDQIPVFENQIDLQSHNLQCHSRQKTKLEKLADQRIDVPFTFDRKYVRVKRIDKTEPDAAGGINITGFIARRIEKTYSFIERDDAPNQFEENVFFDLEACGFEPYKDLREEFKTGDRVTAYALPCTNPNAKSRWKAQRVERIEMDYSEEDSLQNHIYDEKGDARQMPPGERLNEFPSLATWFTPSASAPALSGWSTKLAKAAPIPVNRVVSPQKVQAAKPDHEVGYIHQNLKDTFGFIQKDKTGENFEKNVYFNLGTYVPNGDIGRLSHLRPNIKDLRLELRPGDKVCYTLDKSSMALGAKTKLRASKVWKYMPKSVDEEGFQTVMSKHSSKMKEIVKNAVSNYWDTDSIANGHDAGVVVVEDILEQDKNEAVAKSSVNGESDLRKTIPRAPYVSEIEKLPLRPIHNQISRIPHKTSPASSQGSEAVMTSSVDLDSAFNNFPTHAVNGTHKSFLGKAISMTSLTNGSKSVDLDTSGEYESDEYSSDGEDSMDEDFSDSSRDLQKFFAVLDVCLNKSMGKILRQQMKSVMAKHSVHDLSKIQFVELRKEDNSAHILFCASNANEASRYAKLDGFYPFDSSWSSELKSKKLASKVSRELYCVNGTRHYITVMKGKSEKTRLTFHYGSSNQVAFCTG